jgi:hypothetical protein
MHRRYTIHKDGDLLVEDLDEAGNPLTPEDVAPGDLLPISVVVRAADDADAHGALLELLELAYNIETEGPPEPKGAGEGAPPAGKGAKLPVVE